MVRRMAILTVLCPLSIYLLFVILSAPISGRIPLEEANQHVGKSVSVCGPVASVWYATKSKGKPTFLHIGKSYPNQIITGVIWDHARARFSSPLEELQGREICITGKITLYRGMNQIKVSQPAQIETLMPTP